jgi:bifunctional oligoribonuclease and PAP phosphatase NrnA
MIDVTVPETIFRFIDTYDRFIICGHQEPDGDCLGSQLALAKLLELLGKKTLLVNPGPFNRPETEVFEPLFAASITEEFQLDGAAVIITDCSTIERTGGFQEILGPYPTAVIDHHSSGENFGDARYIVSKAASTTMLVYQLFREKGLTPDKETADYLLFGIATDTGFFRHVAAGTPEVFSIAAELVQAGASPNDIHRRIFGSRTLKSRRLLGTLLHRTESRYGGKLLVTYQTLEDLGTYGKYNKDSDTLYMLLQGIAGVEVVVLIREEDEEECSVGLRSNNDVDVGVIAQNNGGGGHKKASGFTRGGRRAVITDDIISQLRFLSAEQLPGTNICK